MKTLKYLFPAALSLLSLSVCSSQPTERDATSPFEYREIHLPCTDEEAKELSLNRIDNDWGIWGHNLHKILPPDATAVYAQIDGKTTREQYCFSSEQLFRSIEHYVVDSYGDDGGGRFAILPNDNPLVCLCPQCQQAGNTAGNASPAVHNMICRLARRFPGHLFFTSYYLTTKSIPRQPLPDNVGVLVSAMDYPLCTVATKQEDAFRQLLEQWSTKTKHLYVWDYISNFDDYLTPFPVFSVMERRFRLYARTAVKGLFLNGSGTDYTTLGQLKLRVLAAMMSNPDWHQAVISACNRLFPVAGKEIADFVTFQEEWTARQARRLPLYGGIAEARTAYLPEDSFREFCQRLQQLLPATSGSERQEVATMLHAMSFTQLELNRVQGITTNAAALLNRLDSLTSQTAVYSESGWRIADYISDYQTMCAHAEATREANLLKGKTLQPLVPLDEEYDDVSILTDGLLGLPSNYHCGQLLSSATPSLRLAIPNVEGMRRLRISLTSNPRFRISLPAEVALGDSLDFIQRIVPQPDPHSRHCFVEFALPRQHAGRLVIHLVRHPDARTMAIDEVEGY